MFACNQISILGMVAIYCCITTYLKTYRLKTVHIYYLKISVGQESGHSPTGSFAFGSLSGCNLTWRIDWVRSLFPAHMAVGRIHSFEDCWTPCLSSLLVIDWRPPSAPCHMVISSLLHQASTQELGQECQQDREKERERQTDRHSLLCPNLGIDIPPLSHILSIGNKLPDVVHTKGRGLHKDGHSRDHWGTSEAAYHSRGPWFACQ